MTNPLPAIRVGFYGLGDIGLPMATHLFRVGVDLLVFNRTAAKADGLRADGAAVAASVADLVARSDVLITCLHGPDADVEAYLGDGGVVAQGLTEKLVVNTSTIGPELAVRLAGEVEAAGGAYLDCPILSGGRENAGRGESLFPVGGDRAVLERARPVLDVLARQIEYVGPVGAAQVIKLANNFVWAISSVALSQGVQFALAGGADPDGLERILAAAGRPTTPTMRYVSDMVHDRVATRGTYRTLAKDLDLANAFARAVGEFPTVGEAAAAVFHAGLDDDHGRLDVQSLVRVRRRE